ncbi:N,N-dimethylformamidase beta subunit family domain-containing protein [Bacillus sp. NEB1478]|uniref:N,N-dimethylformamidase beta subunit family domain-containing protein n=1 Tax=Bacillus sp. NEB1478 TaxID=3073816 RepID=UPI0028731DC6|nr:N,N-dimethylformamidase beta subunit family domain-containing protein [Bacillus sp. NEB1478]WNB92675.1 cell wall-binding repeat-containing protein [Bacillus sp. NEB1478]
MFYRLLVVILPLLFFITTIKIEAHEIQKNRISGADRFEVAVNVSKKGWPKSSETVVLSNYTAYADALSAAPLAYKINAPILLTQPNKLTLSTKKEITRLHPNKIVIIGGTGSISNSVENEVKALGIEVERIAGKDRFEVSYKISKKLATTGKAIIAYGLNFPDALAIAPYAAQEEAPILLTLTDKVPDYTKKALREKNVKRTYIIGGEGSVGKTVENSVPSPTRIGGKNRFEVASNIVKKLNLPTDNAFLSTGMTFADALTGSVLAAKQNAPILLTLPDHLPIETKEVIYEKSINNFTILGGDGSVGDNVLNIPHQWEISKPSGTSLQGYASATSVFPGEQLNLFIHSVEPYKIQVFRMGYYDEEGAELVKTINNLKPKKQSFAADPSTMKANWSPTVSLKINDTWRTGVYLAKLTNTSQKESYITFVVKDKHPEATIGVMIATNTYQAYNNWGGKSLYGYNSTNGDAAVNLSFDRPYNNGRGSGEFFAYEYNLIRWMEKQGYQMTYFTDTDIDNGLLSNLNSKLILIPGHAEYWTKAMRDSIQNETKSRKNLAVFNANVAYWQVRLQQNDRLMVGYKYRAKEDPYLKTHPQEVTTKFRDEPVNRPEKEVLGLMYSGIPEQKQQPLVISNPAHWLFNGTSLKKGDKIPGVVGGEVDSYDGQMEGVEIIAASPVNLYGESSMSHVIWYNKPTGGKVFAVGTFYWNWFLDSFGHESFAKPNKAIEKITTNAFTKLLEK